MDMTYTAAIVNCYMTPFPVVSATNLANNFVVVNMESIQRLTDSNREYWRVGVENTKAISRSIRF